MTNENNTEHLNKYIHDLERKNANLEKELEKEQNEKIIVIQEKKKLEKENKELKKQLRQLQASLSALATSDKTAEAGAFLLQKHFTNEIDRKERKSLQVVNPDILVMEEKNQPQTYPLCMSHWTNVQTAVCL